jgi:hypothetical protein
MTDTVAVADLLNGVCNTVSARLREMGRSDIAFSRDWLESEDSERSLPRLVARVPVGSKLSLRIMACDRGSVDLSELGARFAEELPAALVNVTSARWSLRRYAGSMRRAAMAAIEASLALGLELSLVGVTFKRTRAFHLGQADWREAADHVIAQVHVGGLDHDLRPTVHDLIIDNPEDVEREILALHDDQLEYQDARNALRGRGASVGVDEVTLRHLDRYGLDRLDTLRAVFRDGSANLEVTKTDGTVGKLHVGSSLGVIRSHIIDNRDYVWLRDRLSFEGASPPKDLRQLVGRLVSDVCPDELYAGMTFGVPDGLSRTEVTINQAIHFVDLETGRFWSDALAA